MAIGNAGKKKPVVTPANKVRESSGEVKYVERISTQQKSSLAIELEKEESIIREVTDKVHKEENAFHEKQLSKITNSNKLFKSVLQVHRIAIEKVNGNIREFHVPQSKLVFDTDDDYYKWATSGGFDKDLNPDHDYVCLRRIVTNKQL